jgi:hypothetical protein
VGTISSEISAWLSAAIASHSRASDTPEQLASKLTAQGLSDSHAADVATVIAARCVRLNACGAPS